MIIYFAGVNGNTKDLYIAVKNGCKHLMLSYFQKEYYPKKQIDRFRKLGLHLFLDSGAFSAWSKKIQIDINDYISYIKENFIGKYIVLDIIGDPEQTYWNLQYMKSKNLYPVPVYHMDDDIKYLEQLINDGYKYICLGGSANRRRQSREEFFDMCFENHPNIYFHGLGMTDTNLMKKYNWYSVDSTTWLSGRKYNKKLLHGSRIEFPPDVTPEEKIAYNVKFLKEIEKSK